MTGDYQPPDIVIVQIEEWQDPEGLGVQFTRPDGTPVFVNARAIAFVRAPLPGESGNATIVFSSGAKQAVNETVQQVIDAIHVDTYGAPPQDEDKEPLP
jgi:uncharacterized protein YlzI (FlbEa/FlbD family)